MSSQQFVPTPKFEEYSELFKDFYKLERRDDGVLLVQAHTEGGPIRLNVQNHRSLGQLLKVIGADPENEVLILTGSGEDFMMCSDPRALRSRTRTWSTGPTSTPTRTAGSTSARWSTTSRSPPSASSTARAFTPRSC